MREEVKCPKSRIGVTTHQSPTQGEIIIGVKGRYAHVASGTVELSIIMYKLVPSSLNYLCLLFSVECRTNAAPHHSSAVLLVGYPLLSQEQPCRVLDCSIPLQLNQPAVALTTSPGLVESRTLEGFLRRRPLMTFSACPFAVCWQL